MLEEIRDYAFYLFERSAILFSVMLLGFLSKKYKPLVNQKIANKEKLIIKIATDHEALRESPRYCKLLKKTLKKMAKELWDENEGFFIAPSFKIIAAEDGIPLGLAFLALHDE